MSRGAKTGDAGPTTRAAFKTWVPFPLTLLPQRSAGNDNPRGIGEDVGHAIRAAIVAEQRANQK